MAGIYLHIPFCRKRCNYCNFFSIASINNKEQYIDILEKEIILRREYLKKDIIKTIYIGGGTPSLLSGNEINRLLDIISFNHSVTPDAEITIEANPDDIDDKWIAELKQTDVNRISLGIQSFSDTDLQYLGRQHNALKGLQALKIILNAGYSNLSADIIIGLPSQNKTVIENNLTTLIEMGIPHISCYLLTVEPGTPLEKLLHKGIKAAIDEEDATLQFYSAMNLLVEKGYIHYEISNYCLNGMRSKHNSSYWFGEKYQGIGASAHSFNTFSRMWNPSSVKDYISEILSGKTYAEMELLSEDQLFNEYVLLHIRTIEGCDTDYIEKRFGRLKKNYLIQQAEKISINNMIIIDNNFIKLSDKGKIFADKITLDLIY